MKNWRSTLFAILFALITIPAVATTSSAAAAHHHKHHHGHRHGRK